MFPSSSLVNDVLLDDKDLLDDGEIWEDWSGDVENSEAWAPEERALLRFGIVLGCVIL
jgi:hypothetical protein